jgi:HEAT repeat protein
MGGSTVVAALIGIGLTVFADAVPGSTGPCRHPAFRAALRYPADNERLVPFRAARVGAEAAGRTWPVDGSFEADLSTQSTAMADARTKGAALAEASRSASIAALIEVLRPALRDTDRTVRLRALAALASRAFAAGAAGRALMVGPSPPGWAPPVSAVVPLEWRGDRSRLNDAFGDDVSHLLRTDPDGQIRHAALVALLNLLRPEGAEAHSPALVNLVIEAYQRDDDARVRTECVKTLRLIPNDSPTIRQVLRDALVGPSEVLQHEAQSAITGPHAKLTFAEVEPALKEALRSSTTSVRVGAVRALNMFGGSSASYLAVLQDMEQNDIAPEVRTAARLAIKSITGQPGEVW